MHDVRLGFLRFSQHVKHLHPNPLAVRHIVAPPPHYAAKLQLETVAGEAICAGYARMFAGLYASVKPGGHVFIGDHVVHQHPGVFQHCKLLEAAGFTDIDAWIGRLRAIVRIHLPIKSGLA
eukprot:g30288.t1